MSSRLSSDVCSKLELTVPSLLALGEFVDFPLTVSELSAAPMSLAEEQHGWSSSRLSSGVMVATLGQLYQCAFSLMHERKSTFVKERLANGSLSSNRASTV